MAYPNGALWLITSSIEARNNNLFLVLKKESKYSLYLHKSSAHAISCMQRLAYIYFYINYDGRRL